MNLKNVLIVVANIELSKKFYCDVLEFGIIKDFGDNVMMTGGLVLQAKDSWEGSMAKEGTSTEDASAFSIPMGELYLEESEFDSFVDRLNNLVSNNEYDIHLVGDVYENSFGKRTIRFTDMDGHLIEVSESVSIANAEVTNENEDDVSEDSLHEEEDIVAEDSLNVGGDIVVEDSMSEDEDIAAEDSEDVVENAIVDESDSVDDISDLEEAAENDSSKSIEESEGAEKEDAQIEDDQTENIETVDISSESIEEKKTKNTGKYIGRTFAFIGITLLMLVIFLYCGMFVLIKGPSTHVRDLFVLSLKESSAGGILADLYLSEEEILAIQEANKFEETDEVTDVSIVQIPIMKADDEEIKDDNSEPSFIVETSYDTNIYVENGIEFHEIKGATFEGIMAVVEDPSRVFIGASRDRYDGSAGLSVPEIADKYGAILATNGAFFEDTGGVGNGGIPLGFVFSEGEEKYGGTGTVYNMLGFNQEGVLICGRMTGQQAINYGIRDGLSCNPFLIINGEMVNVSGTGGGLNPRTALGQRADGAVLMLVIDGRMATSLGASMVDVADVMYAFGAVNAGNLDGGGSSVLYYNKEIKNVVMSVYGARGIPDAVCVRP